jgi:hypothetical protein
MQYNLTTIKKHTAVIKLYLKDKATSLGINEEGHETLQITIEDGDDLKKILHAGIEICDDDHNQSEWYYSETHL